MGSRSSSGGIMKGKIEVFKWDGRENDSSWQDAGYLCRMCKKKLKLGTKVAKKRHNYYMEESNRYPYFHLSCVYEWASKRKELCKKQINTYEEIIKELNKHDKEMVFEKL